MRNPCGSAISKARTRYIGFITGDCEGLLFQRISDCFRLSSDQLSCTIESLGNRSFRKVICLFLLNVLRTAKDKSWMVLSNIHRCFIDKLYTDTWANENLCTGCCVRELQKEKPQFMKNFLANFLLSLNYKTVMAYCLRYFDNLNRSSVKVTGALIVMKLLSS